MARTKWGMLVAVAALVAGLFVGSVQAQQGGPGRGGRGGGFGGGFGGGGGGGAMMLVRNEAVQKELGLSAEAQEKLTKLAETTQSEMRETMQKIVGEGGFQALQGDPEKQKQLQDAQRKLQEKTQGELKSILSAEQMGRIKQITYQMAGAAALNDAELAKELGLSDEQKGKIKAAVDDAQSKTRELFQGGPGEGAREKMQEINKARDEQVVGVLTADQKSAFEKAKGKPFDVAQLRGGGRGGFGGGQGGPGGKPGGAGKPGRPGRPSAEAKPETAPKQ